MDNLLGILSNHSLGVDLRRSAARQLLPLAAERRFQQALSSPAVLAVLMQELQSGTAAAGCANKAESQPMGQHVDIQLLTACLDLAASIALHHLEARQWLLDTAQE